MKTGGGLERTTWRQRVRRDGRSRGFVALVISLALALFGALFGAMWGLLSLFALEASVRSGAHGPTFVVAVLFFVLSMLCSTVTGWQIRAWLRRRRPKGWTGRSSTFD